MSPGSRSASDRLAERRPAGDSPSCSVARRPDGLDRDWTVASGTLLARATETPPIAGLSREGSATGFEPATAGTTTRRPPEKVMATAQSTSPGLTRRCRPGLSSPFAACHRRCARHPTSRSRPSLRQRTLAPGAAPSVNCCGSDLTCSAARVVRSSRAAARGQLAAPRCTASRNRLLRTRCARAASLLPLRRPVDRGDAERDAPGRSAAQCRAWSGSEMVRRTHRVKREFAPTAPVRNCSQHRNFDGKREGGPLA